MAVMVTGNAISLEYPTKRVFERVSFGINEGDRIGIVGRNGDGKSSLLKTIAGLISPDEGHIISNGKPTIGFLQQKDAFDDSAHVEDYLVGEDAIPWEADRKSREIVYFLLHEINPKQEVATLSGGQRRRLDLARLLMRSWDILLLDEPTNHLDIASIHWLAQHLKHRWQEGEGALLVVTHDRWFLDEVCTKMWEVYQGNVLPFEGGFSAYVMQRVERARLEEVAKQKRANQLRKELAWLSRGAQARRSKPKFHLEQAAALIADVPPLRNPIELKNAAMTRLGKQVIELDKVSISFEGTTVLDNIEWILGPGDRIGILGENGAGKTSFLKLLTGELPPTKGSIKVGKTVHLAGLSQTLEELDPVRADMVRVVCARYKNYYHIDGKMLSPTALLERIGFTRDELNARCGDLSGGQQRRLQLVFTLLEEPNVLILDEPGNDLDTDMMAAMEELLDTWPGTLVVVSHDRYLIERVTDDQFALVDGHLYHLPGGVDEYLERYARNASGEPVLKQPVVPALHEQDTPENDKLSNAQAYATRKKLSSVERKLTSQQRRLDEARARMNECDPSDFEALGLAQQNIDKEAAILAELEDEWLNLSLALQ